MYILFAYYFVGGILAFFASYYFVKWIIPFHKEIGLFGVDINKPDRPVVAESAGVPIVLAQILGLSIVLIFDQLTFQLFTLPDAVKLEVLALASSLMVIIGYLEDLTLIFKRNLKKKNIKEVKKIGFSQKLKLLLPLIPALPVILVNIKKHTISLLFHKIFDVGLLYPLLLIPVGLSGAANATNILAGLNGLEAMLGIVTGGGITIYAFHHQIFDVALYGIVFVASLLGFYMHNKYPSKIFPGDSVNYFIGFSIAGMAIQGDLEKFALSIFVIWFIELVLKARSKFQAECYGVPQKDGSLAKIRPGIYSFTHLFMDKGLSEKQIAKYITLIQAIIVAIMLFFTW